MWDIFTIRSLLGTFFLIFCDCFSTIVKLPITPMPLPTHFGRAHTRKKKHPDTYHLCVTIPQQICRFTIIEKTCSMQRLIPCFECIFHHHFKIILNRPLPIIQSLCMLLITPPVRCLLSVYM